MTAKYCDRVDCIQKFFEKFKKIKEINWPVVKSNIDY